MTLLTLTQTRNHRMTKQPLPSIIRPSSVLVVFHAQHQNDAVATASALLFGYPPDDIHLFTTTLCP